MKYLSIITTSILLGFAFTSIVVAILRLNKKENIRRIGAAFLVTAMSIVRWVGLFAFVIWMLGTIWDFFNGGITSRATDAYAGIYWMMVLGPLISQLLWLKKVRNSFLGVFFVASGLIWTSGIFLEDLTITISRFQGDYAAIAWQEHLETLLKYFMRIATFIALVWLVQSINVRRKLTRNKLKSNT